jgi:hypothetical protein
MPATRFSNACRLEDLRYLVCCRIYFLGAFRYEGAALTFRRAEAQGWPQVFDNGAFRVFENPRFGIKADPYVRILMTQENEKLAAEQAARAQEGQGALPPL